MKHVAVGLALAPLLWALLPVLALFWATSPASAQAALRKAVASLTQADALLAAEHDDLRREAAQSEGESAHLAVPAFPLPVFVAAGDILALSSEELTAVVVDQAARKLYRTGPSLFAVSAADDAAGQQGLPAVEEPVSGIPRPQAKGPGIRRIEEDGGHRAQEIALISSLGALRLAMGLFTEVSHRALRLLALAVAAAALLLALAFWALAPASRRLEALGAVLLAAAFPSLLLAMIGKAGLGLLPGGPLMDAILLLAQRPVNLLLRIDLGLVLVGTVLLVLRSGLGWLQRARREEWAA